VTLPVEDLEEATGTEFEVEDVDTVGGLLAQRLGRVPLPGAEAEIAGLRLRAEGGEDGRGRMRIRSLLVWRPPADEDSAPSEDGDAAPVHGASTANGDDAERADPSRTDPSRNETEGDLAQAGARDGKDDRG